MKPNITQLVVEQDKCIGCGVCQAVCPVNVLPMEFGQYGVFEPHEIDGCLDKCTLCIDVCPFVEKNDDEITISNALYAKEKGITFHEELGYIVETYTSYVLKRSKRVKSASGGIGNFVLKKLLEDDIVDCVLTIAPTAYPEQLFRFEVFQNQQELNSSVGSVYYPTEISEVLDYVTKNEGRYAITVLPCYAKAIRLAQQKNRLLRKRIKVVVGLVCGQMKSKFFTEELAKIALNGKVAQEVSYRVKNPQMPANNFSFQFVSENTEKIKMQWSEEPSVFWTNRMFTPLACNHCTDTFAYTADIVLMDAWLPEYVKNYLGHTLLIVRRNDLKELLENYADEEIALNPIDSRDVYKSQEGVVKNKSYFAKDQATGLMKIIVELKKIVQKRSFSHTYKSLQKYLLLIKITQKILDRLKWMKK